MKLIVRNTHKYLSFFISIQLLLWTISGIYFAFNKIENVRGEQYRAQTSSDYNFNKIEFEIPNAESVNVKKRLGKTIIAASTKNGMRYFNEEGGALQKISFDEAKQLVKDGDPEIREMAEIEIEDLTASIKALEIEIKRLLLPKDPDDSKDVFLEVRAGAGGDEAALFAGDLFRMYSRLSERNNWNMDVVSIREGDHGGYKELVTRIEGNDVYKQLKFEAGVHRVQRVPATESQGRVHTSACSVAVLPEMDEIDEINIDKNDLRVDTFRASGAGGQHVNKTDSAVRLTHLPTGIVVECQDGRSQHKNKEKALSLLQSKLLLSLIHI